MSMTFPRTIGSVTVSETNNYDLVIEREMDMLRYEQILQVSCRIRNRYYVRRITFHADSMTNDEQLQLADCLGNMIRADVIR